MPILKSSAVSQLLEISKIRATIPGEKAAIEYPTACVIIDRERVILIVVFYGSQIQI